MSADLERLGIKAKEIAERFSNYPELADVIHANAAGLAASAALVSILENAAEPSQQTDLPLADILDTTTIETPEAKKARILAIEDPLIRYREVLSILRPPTDEELSGLKGLGYTPFTILAQSLGEIVAQDRNEEFFATGQMSHLDEHKSIRDYVPSVGFLVGVRTDPEHIFIQDSDDKSQEDQARMTDSFSKREIEPVLPNALAIMLPTTGYVQVDRAFFMRAETRGTKLFKNFRARGSEKFRSGGSFASGRFSENQKFMAHSYESKGYSSIVAVAGIVFI